MTRSTNGATYYLAVDGKGSSIERTDAITLSWRWPGAPEFLFSPVDTDVLVGNGIVLSSLAVGNPAPAFFWRFNSTNTITGATFASYTNSSVQLTNQGFYDVIASNSLGTSTSVDAYLKVFSAPTATFTNYALVNGHLEVLIDGVNGYTYTVQGTTDYLTWTNLTSGVCDFVFTNYYDTNFPIRIFRTFY